jgi:hypothetical protein
MRDRPQGDPHLLPLAGAVRGLGTRPVAFGWTCASAAAHAWPRLATRQKGRSRIAAYAPAD